ncbi:MAG: NUDIX hydrolase [Hyphomicrobiaceae bacterium]|nr:NUDIX hydrolase [Hyphomicrobiaceae bacterium]
MPSRTDDSPPPEPGTGKPVSGEVPEPSPSGRTLTPRDAATLVLVDRAGPEPRVLMGRRRSSQVFLPNKFVFPGGRVDRADRTMASTDDLPEAQIARLLFDMKGTPSPNRARAMALAAIRETFEETGVLIGTRPPPGRGKPASAPTNATWRQFLGHGVVPSLSGLSLLARAITPPARPRRYDTRFFLADASAIAGKVNACDEELNEIGWFTLSEMRALDLPNITRAIVEDLASHLGNPGRHAPVPYYRFQRGTFRRDLIT